MTPEDIAKFVDELQRGHRSCPDPGCWRREAARLIEALATPPDITMAIHLHACKSELAPTYISDSMEKSEFVRGVIELWIPLLEAAHEARLRSIKL